MSGSDYTPRLPEPDWDLIRSFVIAVVDDVAGKVAYPSASLMHTVTHHVHWAHLVAGFDLDRAALFRRAVIGYSVAMMPTTSPSTMGRHRSILLRVGEVLTVIEVPDPLPPLAAADPTVPYRASDVEDLRAWAYLQRTPADVRSAQALLALGLGAGLPTRELARVTRSGVSDDAKYVTVGHGADARVVPLLGEWVADLAEVRTTITDDGTTLFRPGVAFHKNTVVTFVKRTIGIGLRPTTQRMRATWLVHHLACGTPMQDLLFMAGLKSMDALVRYQRFLPAPGLAGSSDTPARTPGSPLLRPPR